MTLSDMSKALVDVVNNLAGWQYIGETDPKARAAHRSDLVHRGGATESARGQHGEAQAYETRCGRAINIDRNFAHADQNGGRGAHQDGGQAQTA